MSWPFGNGGMTTDNQKNGGGGGFFFQSNGTTVTGHDNSVHRNQGDYYNHLSNDTCYSGSLIGSSGKVYDSAGEMAEDEARASITGFMGL